MVSFGYFISQQMFRGEQSAIFHLKEHKKYLIVQNASIEASSIFFKKLNELNLLKKGEILEKQKKKKLFPLSWANLM